MQLQQMKQRLHAALPIRCPILNPQVGGREKVSSLEDYLAQTAHHRGELEEALYWAWELEKVLRDKWEAIEGWENVLPRDARQRPTEKQKTAARARIDRGTYDALSELKTVIAAIERQIKRLELDDKNTSRRYSLLTGSS